MYRSYFIAFTVIFQAPGALAVAPLGVFADRLLAHVVLGFANLGTEGGGIPFQAAFDRFLPELLVLEVVVAVDAVAHVAEFAARETITVQLQALRLRTVARLARPDAVALHVRIC